MNLKALIERPILMTILFLITKWPVISVSVGIFNLKDYILVVDVNWGLSICWQHSRSWGCREITR